MKIKSTELWEIYVPTMGNDGRPFRTRFHRVWDKEIRGIAGGLTILPPVVGQWVNDGTIYKERVIPVRIACSREQIEKIMEFTAKKYNQIAVMAAKISDTTLIYTK